MPAESRDMVLVPQTADDVKARFGLDPDETGNRPRGWRIVDEGESRDIRAFNGTDIPAGSLAVHTRDGAANPICAEACRLPNFIGTLQDDYDSTYRDYFYAPLTASPARGERDAPFTVDELAQEIRRVDGNHSLGAGALAEALMPFLSRPSPGEGDAPVACPTCNGTGFQRVDDLSERSCVGCGGSGLAKDRDAKRAWISAAVSRPSPSPGDGDAPASIVIDDATRDAALRSGKKLNDWITGALHKAAELAPSPGEGDTPVARRILWAPGEDWDFSDEADDPLTDADVERLRAQGYVVDRLYTHPTPATPAGEELREKVSLALDNWIVCGLREADRKLASIDPVGCSGMTQEDVDAGRVAAYQKGYQNGVKATLTDAAYVIRDTALQPQAAEPTS